MNLQVSLGEGRGEGEGFGDHGRCKEVVAEGSSWRSLRRGWTGQLFSDGSGLRLGGSVLGRDRSGMSLSIL